MKYKTLNHILITYIAMTYYRVPSDRHTFITYPFPRQLLVDIKPGFYKVIGDGDKEEIIEADNAKDALGKTAIKEANKIEYLGFSNKFILKAEELIEDENYVKQEPVKAATEKPEAEKPKTVEAPEEKSAIEPPAEIPDAEKLDNEKPPNEIPDAENKN